MARLFEDMTVVELEALFRARPAASPCPSLFLDTPARHRVRRLARENGIWADLDTNLDSARPIPVLRRSVYREYRRCGNRAGSGRAWAERCAELARATMALWLEHPKADLDYLQDLIWAFCDNWTWVGTAHEDHSDVDLVATAIAVDLAEIVHVFGERIEPEVRERVYTEIERRIYARFDAPKHWWRQCEMNWNHVCNGNIMRLALLTVDDPGRRAALVHRLVIDMQLALDGFTADGGCTEGPSYWTYGFGHFVKAAYALYACTGGAVNLMTADPKIGRICRYPLAAWIEGDRRATFADAAHGWVPAEIPLRINRMYRLPELYALCEAHPDGRLVLRNQAELALYGHEHARPVAVADALLPDLGLARIRSRPGPRRMTIMALAGNNGVPHNHNDIGSFIVYRGGRALLADPGAPIYAAKTFSPQRYEIIFCNSLGHSVPLINGRQQPPGASYLGTIAAEGLNGTGDKTVRIDMSRAYAPGTVKALTRILKLDFRRHALEIADEYKFARRPREVVETFVTYEAVRLSADRRSVQIGPVKSGGLLTADQPGRFAIVREVAASKEGKSGKVLERILFRPADLARDMLLRFRLN